MPREDLSKSLSHASSARHSIGRACLAALALSLVLASPGLAAICDSLASGSWGTAGNWSCGTVPTVGDIATVQAGHFVTSGADISVNSLFVAGSGVLEMQGFSLQIKATWVEVQPGGTLQGSSGATGSNVTISAPFGASMTVRNKGMIRGGSPGGSVFIYQSNGGDLPCPNGSVIDSSGGVFLGGAGSGNIYLLAEVIDLQSSIVIGGSGFVPFNFLGQSRAGSVYIAGVDVTIDSGSFITSGTNTNTAPGALGGSVKIVAQSCLGGSPSLVIGAGSTVTVGGPSSGGCPGALVYSAGTSSILGAVAPGPSTCVYWDPPDLKMAGNAEINGGQVILAGASLDATGLASRTLSTPAIDAADTLEINVNPGGTADFRGLTPGFVYFRAGGGIIIRADEILTDAGVGLEDLMDPPPDVTEGAPTLMFDMTGDHQQFVSPGSSIQYQVQVTNIGSVSADFDVKIKDSEGWLTGGPQFISQTLAPGEAILRTLTIDVPIKVRSRSTTLGLSASMNGKPPEVSYAIFVING